jgi:tRNA (guanine26-N2/guanine27-N2)-dimethyltransferase
MWLAPIHDVAFVNRVLKSIEGSEKDYGTWPRIHGMLSLAANVRQIKSAVTNVQEIEDPFYLTANKLFGTCHSSSATTTKVLYVVVWLIIVID